MSFLIAHQVYPNFFNLSGPLAPISIRDQMVRAQAIVEDAIAEGLIGPPDRPLLVVGAGAAGAAAAIWAADHRVPTTLIDRGPSAFTLQAACTTRRIDPSQYDWPVDHWVTPDFPCVPFPTAMRWSETFSHLLAAGWQAQLKAAEHAYPSLAVHYKTKVAGPGEKLLGGDPAAPIGWALPLDGGLTGTHNFAMVLWTVGFAPEVCTCGAYRGFAFWEEDRFVEPNCGLTAATPADVVILGAGDGALQDFLRITTGGLLARNILGTFFRLAGSTFLPRDQVERELHCAEDLAQRAASWGPGRRGGATDKNDHATLQRLHDAHDRLVQALLFVPGPAGPPFTLYPGAAAALAALVAKATAKVRLIHSCTHFSNAYGLNRFLVLLIGRYLEALRGPGSIFIGQRRVAEPPGVVCKHPTPINPTDCLGKPHELNPTDCLGKPHELNPTDCLGKPHELNLEQALDCRRPVNPPVAAGMLTANVVIIRHGLDNRSLPAWPPRIPLSRQLTPYHPLA